jgi:hypothetical protein
MSGEHHAAEDGRWILFHRPQATSEKRRFTTEEQAAERMWVFYLFSARNNQQQKRRLMSGQLGSAVELIRGKPQSPTSNHLTATADGSS